METFSALLAICAGNSPVHGEFLTQRPVTRGFDVFFDLRLNKRLSGWWLKTLSCSLWRQNNEMSSFCQNLRPWLHWKLSIWKLLLQTVTHISSRWHFGFTVYLLDHFQICANDTFLEQRHSKSVKARRTMKKKHLWFCRQRFAWCWPSIRGVPRLLQPQWQALCQVRVLPPNIPTLECFMYQFEWHGKISSFCSYITPCWRHQMETFSALLAICAGRWISRTKASDAGALMFSLICVWING